MRMLGMVLAAGLSLGARPPELVRPGEEAAYAVWIEGQARAAAGYYAHKDCAAAAVRPLSSGPAADEAVARRKPGVFLYQETMAIDGCGAADAQGLVVMRETRGWGALPTAPGDSVAGLALQREVLPSVILAVKAAAERDTSCTLLEKAQSALVYDTRILSPAPAGQPWSERWFMSVCGAGYKVDIAFSPGGARTAYAVRMAPEDDRPDMQPRPRASGSPGVQTE
jgi:hypothetical protein